MRQTVTIRNPRHLSLRDNRLVIREKDPESRSETALAEIPLSDIWVVILMLRSNSQKNFLINRKMF